MPSPTPKIFLMSRVQSIPLLPDSTPRNRQYDIVIVGGAMYGTAVAWFLMDNPDFDGSVLVVERDPTYAMCSTTYTNSCIRQQFSNAINVRISQFGAEYIRNFRQYLGNDSRVPDLTLQNFGYLYLADNDQSAEVLCANQKVQIACGAGTRILYPEEIQAQYPFYSLEDIVLGSLNTQDEGYFDGGTLFQWWRKAAREKGAEYVANTVVSMMPNRDGGRIAAVTLASGERIHCGTVVNASGPRAVLTARMAGIEIPVEPRKRYSFVFDAAHPLSRDLPLTIDPSGVHMRTEGPYYLAGCPPEDDRGVDYDDFSEEPHLWEGKVWPTLARRIPQFETIRLVNSWVGHYAYNRLDQNAIVGPHTEIQNFLFVNGFSGHGLQQSPAIGRGLAEWIVHGEYRSLDLTPFHYRRIKRNEPFSEKAII